MSVTLADVSSDQLEAFHDILSQAFGVDPTEELLERFRVTFELDRLRAAMDGDQIVATFGGLSLQLTVPGNSLPTAGTTVVTVLPTHRRQGILRQMMHQHLHEVHARGEPLAALWASESTIYGRFGYGPASWCYRMKLNTRTAELADPPDIAGTMRLVDQEEALAAFPEILAEVTRQRPGMFDRPRSRWEHRALGEHPFGRMGASELRRVLHSVNGQPLGYALYRTAMSTTDEPNQVRVQEVIAKTPAARQALWQFLMRVDLFDSLRYTNQPIDDPLRWWLRDPRQLKQDAIDALWIRPVDVTKALEGRRYRQAGNVTFNFHDTVCSWNNGTFELHADGDGQATCRPTTRAAELSLTPKTLGTAYLGGNGLRDLATAGLVTGDDTAIRTLDAMLSWHTPPWCQEIF